MEEEVDSPEIVCEQHSNTACWKKVVNHILIGKGFALKLLPVSTLLCVLSQI